MEYQTEANKLIENTLINIGEFLVETIPDPTVLDILMNNTEGFITNSKFTHYSNCEIEYDGDTLSSDYLTQYGHIYIGNVKGFVAQSTDNHLAKLLSYAIEQMAISPSASLTAIQAVMLLTRIYNEDTIPELHTDVNNNTDETTGVKPYEL